MLNFILPFVRLKFHQLIRLAVGAFPVRSKLTETISLPDSVSGFGHFVTSGTNFRQLFPGIRSKLCTLSFHFFVPVFREVALGWGMLSASKSNIKYALSQSNAVAADCNADGYTSNAVSLLSSFAWLLKKLSSGRDYGRRSPRSFKCSSWLLQVGSEEAKRFHQSCDTNRRLDRSSFFLQRSWGLRSAIKWSWHETTSFPRILQEMDRNRTRSVHWSRLPAILVWSDSTTTSRYYCDRSSNRDWKNWNAFQWEDWRDSPEVHRSTGKAFRGSQREILEKCRQNEISYRVIRVSRLL